MDLSVIVCTHERYDVLENAIRSLKFQTLQNSSFEIIVIDNSGTRNDSTQSVHDGIGNVRWINESRPGLSNARNRGVEMAKGKIIAFMDDDAVASESWAKSLVETFSGLDMDVVAAGGPVLPLWDAPRPIWLADGLLGYLSLVNHGLEKRFLKKGEWVAGTNMAFRRKDLVELGSFNTNLGRVGTGEVLLSNEETEILDRFHKMDKKIAYCPDAVMYHQINVERLTPKWFRRRVAWQAVSDYLRNPLYYSSNYHRSMSETLRYLQHHGHGNLAHLEVMACDTQSDSHFHWQVTAIYNLVFCVLSGLEDNKLAGSVLADELDEIDAGAPSQDVSQPKATPRN